MKGKFDEDKDLNRDLKSKQQEIKRLRNQKERTDEMLQALKKKKCQGSQKTHSLQNSMSLNSLKSEITDLAKKIDERRKTAEVESEQMVDLLHERDFLNKNVIKTDVDRVSTSDLKQQLRCIDTDNKSKEVARMSGIKLEHGQLPIRRSVSASSIGDPKYQTGDMPEAPEATKYERKQLYRSFMKPDRQSKLFFTAPQGGGKNSDRFSQPALRTETRTKPSHGLSNSTSLTALKSKERLGRAWVTAKDLKCLGEDDKLEQLYQTEMDLMNQELGPRHACPSCVNQNSCCESCCWHPDSLTLCSELALTKRARGGYTKLTESEDLLRKVVVDRRQVIGQDHVSTLTAMNNLAMVLEEQWVSKEASWEPLNPDRRHLQEKKFMPKLHEADNLLQLVLDVNIRKLGCKDPDTLSSVRNSLSVVRRLLQFYPERLPEIHKFERMLKTKKVRSHTP